MTISNFWYYNKKYAVGVNKLFRRLNMKKKIVFGVVAFLFVLQAEIIFAEKYPQDYSKPFIQAMHKNDFSKMQSILDDEQKQANRGNIYNGIRFGDWIINYILRKDSKELGNYNYNNAATVLKLLAQYRNKRFDSSDLSNALSHNHTDDVIKVIIEFGNPTDLLAGAIQSNRLDLVKNLVDKGADINSDKRLLRIATRIGSLNIVKYLVENNVNINSRDDEGNTAASIAYDKGEMEIYNYLKANGAIDFEPKQVTAQPASPPPSSSTTNVYVQPSVPAQVAPAPTVPRTTTYTVSVWYLENGTRKLMPQAVSATSKDEAEREAERAWKRLHGANNKLTFLEAVCN